MKILLVLMGCCIAWNASCQYYFNDILANQLTNDQYKILRANKIKKITASSYEPDNSISEGFKLEQDISLDGKRITLYATTAGGKKQNTNTQYDLGKIKKSQSFSNGIDSKTEYFYSDKGQLQKIIFTTSDTAMKTVNTEVHEWSYSEAGIPVQMIKIKNLTDSVQIELQLDDKGLVTEERWKKKNKGIETYYYYYDEKNQLTDIVRFNSRRKQFFPDYLYEYDENGKISQLTQVSMSSGSYLIWKYQYNEKGLKVEETGFDKERKLIGKMVYTYE